MKWSEGNIMFKESILRDPKWFNRFAVALGGFLIFVGIIVIGVFLILFFGMMDISILETRNLQSLFFLLLLAIGLIDLVAGIILLRR
jgi:hypothetical protein